VDLIILDFETYYSKDYTLRKMTPIEYILDPRFEALGVAVKHGLTDKSQWIDGPDIPDLIKELSIGSEKAVVTYNALFDAAILAWRYSWVPHKLIDAMGMVRAMLSYKLKSVSLDAVSKHLGLGAKGTTLTKMVGVHYAEIIRNPSLHRELASYCCDDNEKCASIFKRLIRDFPARELDVMDLVLKATVLPQFRLDRELLIDHLAHVLKQKEEMLALTSVVDAGELRSNDKFASLLQELGVDPPRKQSLTTGNKTWAFAKTDSGFIDLAEHEDPRVQALVAARLGHKTTLEETRTQRLITISSLSWPVGERWMPIPLRFSGAHTHRLSGDMRLNMQNLPRKSPLRSALQAPKGYLLVSIDMSQIEARIVAWICEQLDLLEAFALGEDVYSQFAADVFDVQVSKKVNPDYRFIGKTAILGLGYGMSHNKFVISVKSGSKNQLGRAIELTPEVAKKVVDKYRYKYSDIQKGWAALQSTGIPTLARGGTWMFGPCKFDKHEILLPNGFKLFYDDLEQINTAPNASGYNQMQWRFAYAGRFKFLYGAKTLENITQALAQIIIKDLALRAFGAGLRFAHQVHDELIFVVKEKHADQVKRILLEMAAMRPNWAPELPLASEVKIGPSYGEMVG